MRVAARSGARSSAIDTSRVNSIGQLVVQTFKPATPVWSRTAALKHLGAGVRVELERTFFARKLETSAVNGCASRAEGDWRTRRESDGHSDHWEVLVRRVFA